FYQPLHLTHTRSLGAKRVAIDDTTHSNKRAPYRSFLSHCKPENKNNLLRFVHTQYLIQLKRPVTHSSNHNYSHQFPSFHQIMYILLKSNTTSYFKNMICQCKMGV